MKTSRGLRRRTIGARRSSLILSLMAPKWSPCRQQRSCHPWPLRERVVPKRRGRRHLSQTFHLLGRSTPTTMVPFITTTMRRRTPPGSHPIPPPASCKDCVWGWLVLESDCARINAVSAVTCSCEGFGCGRVRVKMAVKMLDRFSSRVVVVCVVLLLEHARTRSSNYIYKDTAGSGELACARRRRRVLIITAAAGPRHEGLQPERVCRRASVATRSLCHYYARSSLPLPRTSEPSFSRRAQAHRTRYASDRTSSWIRGCAMRAGGPTATRCPS